MGRGAAANASCRARQQNKALSHISAWRGTSQEAHRKRGAKFVSAPPPALWEHRDTRATSPGIVPIDVEIGEAALLALSR